MNLKEIRKSAGLSQAKFGAILCMSWRQYNRCEKSNELQPQAMKILELIIELKKIHGFIDLNVDCIKIRLKNKSPNDVAKELVGISESIKGLLDGFI